MRSVTCALIVSFISASAADLDLITGEGALRAVVARCEPDADSRDYLLYLSSRFVRAMQRQYQSTDRQVEEMIKEGLQKDVSKVVCDRKALRDDFEHRDLAVAQILGEPSSRIAPPLSLSATDANAPEVKRPQQR